jgi:hypothetical protein
VYHIINIQANYWIWKCCILNNTYSNLGYCGFCSKRFVWPGFTHKNFLFVQQHVSGLVSYTRNRFCSETYVWPGFTHRKSFLFRNICLAWVHTQEIVFVQKHLSGLGSNTRNRFCSERFVWPGFTHKKSFLFRKICLAWVQTQEIVFVQKDLSGLGLHTRNRFCSERFHTQEIRIAKYYVG